MALHTLSTARCTLRRLSHEDAKHVWSAAHTPGFTEGMTWEPPKDFDEIRAYTDMCLKEWESGERFVWTIEAKDDGAFIGRIEVHRDEKLPGSTWGLGFWIHPMQQGNGYATEVTKEVIRFAFEHLHADSIVSSHHDWNAASGRVHEKIGMRHTGFSEGRVFKHGKPVRSAEFWLDREEWVRNNPI